MRYLVAHLLAENIARAHQKLSGEIADRFDKKDPARRIAPHLTLKAPFEAGDGKIEEVEEVLEVFVQSHDAAPLRLEGFGTFGDRVVYVDAKTDKSGRLLLSDLATSLSRIEWLSMKRGDTERILHATLTRPRDANECKRILEFLSEYEFSFQTELNNIALLQLIEERWHAYRVFEFSR